MASSDQDLGGHSLIGGEFKIQPYELPDGQGYRHLTSMINEAGNELVLFGGLGDGPPFPPTPMNHKVYTLDLKKPPSEQAWEERSTDDVVPEPGFTITRGFVQLGGSAAETTSPAPCSTCATTRARTTDGSGWPDLNVDRRHMGCASVKRRGKPLIYAIAGR